jgi:hypothetical protein
MDDIQLDGGTGAGMFAVDDVDRAFRWVFFDKHRRKFARR